MPTPASAAFRILLPLKVSFLTLRPRFLLPNPNIIPLLWLKAPLHRGTPYKVPEGEGETVMGNTVASQSQSLVLSRQSSDALSEDPDDWGLGTEQLSSRTPT